jgi:hypothetical protein
LAEYFESLKKNVRLLNDLTKQKDAKIGMLHRSITILHDSFSNSMEELENMNIKYVDRSHCEGHAMVVTSGKRLESNIYQPPQSTYHVDFTSKYSVEIAEKLLLVVKDFVHIMLQNDSHSLELSVEELQAREAYEKRIQEEIISLHDALSKWRILCKNLM